MISLLLSAILLLPPPVLAAETILRSPVDRPCEILDEPLPPGTICELANILSPTQEELVDVLDTPSITITGVAELNRPVFLYMLRADGTLVNDIPHTTTANDTGSFTKEIPVVLSDEGTFTIVAHFLASKKDRPVSDTFLQFTGTPGITFRVELPDEPPVDEGCTVNCDDEEEPVDPPTTCPMILYDSPIPGGWIAKFDDTEFWTRAFGGDRSHSFYWAQLEGDASTPAGDVIRNYIYELAFRQAKVNVCEWAASPYTPRDERVALDDPEALKKFIPNVLEKARDANEYFMTIEQARERVAELLVEDGGCVGARGIAPQLNDIVHRDNVGWVFISSDLRDEQSGKIYGLAFDNGVGSMTCGGIAYRITYVSGSSPLLFLSSDTETATSVRVGGPVTYTEGIWDPVVSPEASVAPLYYEFDAQGLVPPTEGWVVPGDETVAFLRSTLASWGYGATEIEAFLAKDVVPTLPESPFVEVRLVAASIVEALLPLSITPAPSSVERVLFHLTPTTDAGTLSAPAPRTHTSGPGLRVVEMGAVITTNE